MIGLGLDHALSAPFKAVLAVDTDWRKVTHLVLRELGAVDGANFGVVYVSDLHASQFNSILTLLGQVTGITHWVGTVGIGIIGPDREVFEEPGLAVMVGTLPDGTVKPLPTVAAKGAPGTPSLADLGWSTETLPLLGLVHADPRTPDLPDALAALADETGTFLVGGLGSSRDSYAQVPAGPADSPGLSGCLFRADLPVLTGLTQGCSPFGPMRTITAGQDNVILTLDDRPALDRVKQDIGPEMAANLRRLGGTLLVALPVEGADTIDYTVRNLIALDPASGAIAIGEHITPGQSMMLVRRDQQAATQDLERMLRTLSRRLKGQRPRGAVYISCLARGPNLFGPNSEEVRLIQDTLGDVPLVGFFANGEIASGRLYGYTGVLTLFL